MVCSGTPLHFFLPLYFSTLHNLLYVLIYALLQREIIDHIIGTGQDENLDMITVTLVDSPDSTKSKDNI
jgi:hypothetical protein